MACLVGRRWSGWPAPPSPCQCHSHPEAGSWRSCRARAGRQFPTPATTSLPVPLPPGSGIVAFVSAARRTTSPTARIRSLFWNSKSRSTAARRPPEPFPPGAATRLYMQFTYADGSTRGTCKLDRRADNLDESDRREATNHHPRRIELKPSHAELRCARVCMMIVVETLPARHPGEYPGVIGRVAKVLSPSPVPEAVDQRGQHENI